MLIGILIIANTAGKCSKETMEKSSNIPSETTTLTESALCIHIYMIVSDFLFFVSVVQRKSSQSFFHRISF
jgi:hypothetical protein